LATVRRLLPRGWLVYGMLSLTSKNFFPDLASVNLHGCVAVLLVSAGQLGIPTIQRNYIVPDRIMTSGSSRNDPSVGTRATGVTKGGSPSVGMVVSDCSTCNDEKMPLLVAAAREHGVAPFVIIINENDVVKLSSFRRRHPSIEVTTLSTSDMKIWNAYFLPRVYALDSDRQFRYVQPVEASLQEAMNSAIDTLGQEP
jgi:hypothetical protein